jgi:HEAT repeat protein
MFRTERMFRTGRVFGTGRGAGGRFFRLFFAVFTIFIFPVFAVPLFAAEGREEGGDSGRRDIIRYGTETEIAALIQSLRGELSGGPGEGQEGDLDEDLAALAEHTRNRGILRGIFEFFGERGKPGLEDRAIRAVEERDLEANETVAAAMDYLGKVGATGAAGALERIIGTKERRFMAPAIRALGRAAAGDREAADRAAAYLRDYYRGEDPPDEFRREIIAALGETGSSAGVSFLAEIGGNSEERVTLRMAALDSLAAIGDEEGLPAIISAVSDGDPNVRASAIAALGPFSGEEVDRAILEGFRDSYYRVRLGAAQASRRGKMAAAVPYLKFRAERDDVPQVRDEAIRALGAIETAESGAALEGLFEDRGAAAAVRIRAAEMLAGRGGEEYIGKIIAEMEDAKARNQTPLYNGLLGVLGGARSTRLEALARRLLGSADIVEKSYALDMAAHNGFRGMAEEIRPLMESRNLGLARKARNVMEKWE